MYSSIAILAVVALVVGLMGITTLRAYKYVVDDMKQVSEGAVLAERINGLILAVVMDSRGIYMAQSSAESEKYAAPLLKNLDRLRSVLTEWQGQVPADRREHFLEARKATEEFIRFRTELVRLSREASLIDARAYGDNDDNRRARSALNDRIKDLAAENETEVGRLSALVGSAYQANVRNLILVLAIGLAVGGISAIVVVSRKIVTPLGRITATTQVLSTGDYSVVVPYADAQDEIGTMAAAVQVFKLNGIEAARFRDEQEKLRAQAEEDKANAMRALAAMVESETRSAIDRVAIETDGMSQNARSMAESAASVGSNAQAVAAAAMQTMSNAETVAAASKQLAASIVEIGHQVSTAGHGTTAAVGQAQAAEDIIHRLANAVTRIDEVAGLIKTIASQTNLLALNATIEAARAGEAGKGFAVVAGEVKNLANQTSRATEEISGQIAEIQAATDSAVGAVQGVAGSIREIESISAVIAAAVEEQGAATQEIARNVEQTSRASQEVSSRIGTVSSEAEATGASANRVAGMASNVAASIDGLRETLVRLVRTANPDVDRRLTPRYAMDSPGTVKTGEGVHGVTVVCCSAGGASFTGEPVQRLASGSPLQLSIAGLADDIPAQVGMIDKGRCRVRFAFDEPAAIRFAGTFASLVKGKEPLPMGG
jgi:methyl-accepting chemotaxis protein